MTTNRREFLGAGLALATTGLAGCANFDGGESWGWETVIDGRRLPVDWRQLGEGNWSVTDGAVQGKNGKAGFLVSHKFYEDFELRAEFWGDDEANSGIFIRCQDPGKIGADTSYEVNIWDKRPDPTYGTGGIVNFAPVNKPYPVSANRWNLYEIVARGDRISAYLNGRLTADFAGAKFRKGPIALQSAAGTIRFRKVEIRAI